MPETFSQPLIVIGCHRSGTSLLTSLLQNGGCFFGKDLSKHTESKYFLKLNVAIYQSVGATWDQPEQLLAELASASFVREKRDWLFQQLRSLTCIRHYWGVINYSRAKIKRFPVWGWKDPRNTITLPLWLELFPQAKVLHICRNGVDVAHSLRARELKRRSRHPLTSERCKTLTGAFALWEAYEQAALNFSQALSRAQYLRIRYEDMLLNPAPEFERLAQFVDCDTVSFASYHVDPQRAYAFRQQAELRRFYEEKRPCSLMAKLGYDQIEELVA